MEIICEDQRREKGIIPIPIDAGSRPHFNNEFIRVMGIFDAICFARSDSDSKREGILSLFNITDAEIEASGEEHIPELVIERVALVDILK